MNRKQNLYPLYRNRITDSFGKVPNCFNPDCGHGSDLHLEILGKNWCFSEGCTCNNFRWQELE